MSEPAPVRTPLPPPEVWCTDGVVIWREPGGPTLCAVLERTERADYARLITAAPRLLHALEACAARLERCVQYAGSDPNLAALAVQEYRDLIDEVRIWPA